MELKILGKTEDLRTNTPVIYAQMSVTDYLSLIGEDFENFRFQRKRVNYKPYIRMREDIIKGALLPPITLAVKPHVTENVKKELQDDNALEEILLKQSGNLNILDGLQRTYILKDLKDEGLKFDPKQQVLLEFWIEREIKHLIYRLIVLNAGQKRMSMRHQVEILFLTIRETLEKEIPNIQIHTQKDGTRRNTYRKYPLDNLVMAYQSFLLKNTEVKRSNLIAQEMVESDVLDSTADDLGEDFEQFKRFLVIYSNLDELTYKHYSEYSNEYWKQDIGIFSEFADSQEIVVPNVKNWFADESVMNSFFAAASKISRGSNRQGYVIEALKLLEYRLENANEYSDPLGLLTLFRIQNGFNPKKVSIEFATRQLLFRGFQEFFRERGEIDIAECWTQGAL
ncbi:hypothetical protein [Bacillus mycoides]|uniref:hypothetical protein n=1 Tax=Bacillus mycoides TaxID=1405 RepID=UPI001C5F1A99|nr:hypothetical protein [Bacillus mycoides]